MRHGSKLRCVTYSIKPITFKRRMIRSIGNGSKTRSALNNKISATNKSTPPEGNYALLRINKNIKRECIRNNNNVGENIV